MDIWGHNPLENAINMSIMRNMVSMATTHALKIQSVVDAVLAESLAYVDQIEREHEEANANGDCDCGLSTEQHKSIELRFMYITLGVAVMHVGGPIHSFQDKLVDAIINDPLAELTKSDGSPEDVKFIADRNEAMHKLLLAVHGYKEGTPYKTGCKSKEEAVRNEFAGMLEMVARDLMGGQQLN